MKLVFEFALTSYTKIRKTLGTDLSTHLSLKKDHPWWAWVTLSWMFMPFAIHVAMFCYTTIRNKVKGTSESTGTGFGGACLHLPFVQTVRNLYNAWKLHKLGYGTKSFDIRNSAEVEAILKEVGFAGQYESFFESGPQSITQCVIILSTGRISWVQILSITISVASLTWGAGRSFFIQREAHLSDPDPPAVMVLARTFFYMFTVTSNSLLLWTFIGGFLGKFTAPAVLFSFVTIYISLKMLGEDTTPGVGVEEGDQRTESSRRERSEVEPQYFCLKAAICAVWIPSVVGDKEKMYLVASIVGLTSKVVLLCIAVGNAFAGESI